MSRTFQHDGLTALCVCVCDLCVEQVIKSFPEMEEALDALSNERERKMTDTLRQKNIKFSRVYANPSQDKVLAATMIQVMSTPNVAVVAHSPLSPLCRLWVRWPTCCCTSSTDPRPSHSVSPAGTPACPSPFFHPSILPSFHPSILPSFQIGFRHFRDRMARPRVPNSVMSRMEMHSFQLMLSHYCSSLRKVQMLKSGWTGSLAAFNRATEQQV